MNKETPKFDSDNENTTNLIVNYIPQTWTQDEVRALFSSIGLVENCNLIRDRSTGQSFGYAFVKFHKAADARLAVKLLDKLRLQNKVIKVSYARPSQEAIKGANLYVNKLPRCTSVVELENLFRPYGQIISSRIIYDRVTGIPKRLGFVRFDKRSEAEKAIAELNGKKVNGSSEPLIVRFANNPTGHINRSVQPPPSPLPLSPSMLNSPPKFFPASFLGAYHSYLPPVNNITEEVIFSLFVSNLSSKVRESLLCQLFEPFGTIQHVKLFKNTDSAGGKSGIVKMLNYNEAVVAMQLLNGFILYDRPMSVTFNKNKALNNALLDTIVEG